MREHRSQTNQFKSEISLQGNERGVYASAQTRVLMVDLVVPFGVHKTCYPSSVMVRSTDATLVRAATTEELKYGWHMMRSCPFQLL